MRPELHLRPDRLIEHAAVASGLSDALQSALRGLGRPTDAGPALGSAPERIELERLDTALRRAAHELGELSAALVAAVAAANRADADAAGVMRLLDGS